MRFTALLCFALTVGFVDVALAQEGGHGLPIVRKLLAANRTLTYSGTRVVEFRQGARRLRHTEIILKDGLRTKVEFPAGSPYAGQVIVEKGGKRFHFHPTSRQIVESDARGDEAVARLATVLRQPARFSLSAAVGSKIAGLETELLTLKDRSGRTVQKLWVHPRTGLVLKRELFGPSGGQVGYFEFTKVDFSAQISAADFELRPVSVRRTDRLAELRELCRAEGFAVAILAPTTGMRIDSFRKVDIAGRKALSIVFRGGGRAVSLFQVRGSMDVRRTRRLGSGGVRTFTWEDGVRTFVLVGELPLAELERLSRRVDVR